MKVHLLAVGTRMPDWVNQGYAEYAKRLPRECALVLKEIPLVARSKNADTAQIKIKEGERLLAAIPKNNLVIVLDERGQSWSTEQLAQQLKDWLQSGQDVTLLVGGPDGLSANCLAHASKHWSLSPLTLPHPLVRILLAEQLYRAWTLLQGHPYHRD